MKYKYLIQNCDAEILNLDGLDSSIKEKIKILFVQDEKGKLARHWSDDFGSTNSVLRPNSIYLLETKPSCSAVLLPQQETEYLTLSNVHPGYSQLPLVGDKVHLTNEDGNFFEISDISSLPFVILLKNQEDIQRARNMLDGTEPNLSIIGTIVKEKKYYNHNYNYHIDPKTIGFFELAMEVCDATFDYVKNNLDEVGCSFLPNNVFCPWTSHITKELFTVNFDGVVVEEVLVSDEQVKIKLNKNIGLSNDMAPIFLEFFSDVKIPGSVGIENYCIDV
jgi:hypothetical protein